MNARQITSRIANSLSSLPTQFLLFAIVSFALRVATFGHPNADGDEAFYFLVGQEMHHGAVPYVDIWDRKPVGLFVIFYLIAGISDSVISYQITAAIFAGATAFVICAISARWAGRLGSVLAGLAYLLMLAPLWGFGGQAPVFYNLFIAVAALLVLESLPALQEGKVPSRAYLAMALCGMAITIKQTTIFESTYFGLVLIVMINKSGATFRKVMHYFLAFAIIGAIPTIIISAYYYLTGNWFEYWHAMVTSNFAKLKPNGVTIAARLLGLYIRLAPLACIAFMGLILRSRLAKPFTERRFVAGWMLAAVIGFLAVPNFYMHYALPLLVPLSVAAAAFFARRDLGIVAFGAVATLAFHWYDPFGFGYTRSARLAFGHMAQSIREHDSGGGLFLFDGPPLLYELSGKKFPSPLVLPSHFNYNIERNVSHLDTQTELIRILDNRPGVVMVPATNRNPRNEEAWSLVLAYVHKNCRQVDAQLSHELIRSDLMLIYGDCGKTEK